MEASTTERPGTLLDRLTREALCVRDPDSGVAWRRWGAGPPVVLLHGSAGSWTHWLRNIESLAQRSTVWVPDLPGCGESANTGDRTYLSLARRMWTSFEQIGGRQPAALVGFSFGSVLAEAMALLEPTRSSKVVLVRGSFDGQQPAFPAGLRRWKGLSAQEELSAHRHNLGITMLHDARRIDDDTVFLHARNARCARVNPIDFSRAGLEESLSRMRVPAAAIRGEFDLFGGSCERQQAAWAASRADDPFRVIAGAGHWVAYEAAARFNAALKAVLSSSSPLVNKS